MSVADPEQPTAPSPPVHRTEGAVGTSEPPPSGHLNGTSDSVNVAQSESPLRCHPDEYRTTPGEPCTRAEESHRLAEESAETPTTPTTPTEEPTTPIARGSILDDLSVRLLNTPRRLTLWYWGAPLLVTLIAAVLRLWNLGSPNSLVFDETYYVKDSWTLVNNGYESKWPDKADAGFSQGHIPAFLDAGSYVVHPPLGKWLIGLGMLLFGADHSFAWRITTALAGIAAVFLLMMVARRLFSSTAFAAIAGFLLAVDGNAIVMSRITLLDNWVMLFGLLSFWFILLDRQRSLRKLANRLACAPHHYHWGPAIWNRPWLFAAAIAVGATCAVKWSGVWFFLALGLYVVVVDTLERRRLGLHNWVAGGILKQGPVSFVLYVPIALVTYLASWTGWFVTTGGWDRSWAMQPGNAATGLWSWLPKSLQSLWAYHREVYGFHLGVTNPHAAKSSPEQWLFMLHPTNMYYDVTENGQPTCGASTCADSVMALGNPLIWWAAAAAVFLLAYRLVRYREWQVALVLLGFAAGYLPWFMYLNRTVFAFYSIAFQPYTMLALAYCLWLFLGRASDPRPRREFRVSAVAVFFGLVIMLTVFFYPLWSGMPLSTAARQLRIWLPGW